MPNKSKQARQEKMSADDKIVAFDFQFEYFLLQLFCMKIGEKVGFEYEEDVHIEHANGKISYIQVKHTVEKDKNITQKDSDMWKTLWSWIKIITDEELRVNQTEQCEFVKNTLFILLTNKVEKNENKIIKAFDDFRREKINLDSLRAILSGVITKRKVKSVTDIRIQEILDVNIEILNIFFKNIKFETDFLDIEDKLTDKLTELHIPMKKHEMILGLIYKAVKNDLKRVVLNKGHLSYTQEQFSLIFQKYTYGYNKKINLYKNFDLDLEERPSRKMTFLKQLDDIDIINFDGSNLSSQKYLLMKYENKLLYEKSKLKWIQDSELPEVEIEQIEENAKRDWLRKYHRHYRMPPNDELEGNEKARKLYYEIEDAYLEFAIDVESPKDLGEGVYLYLSDIPQIGWIYEWEEKYSYADLQ
ncbi:hypothetical protein [Enterococcus sp. AZ192]|uniref:hypothetical protein n=1 Tax=unclassified Enterococcus TaxID=2608891 RepID=UPI003D278543